jgi:hypothetical protein
MLGEEEEEEEEEEKKCRDSLLPLPSKERVQRISRRR